jgi:hypothetical protein
MMFADSAAALFKAYTQIKPNLCTETSCPRMTAGSNYVYLWADDTGSDPQEICARDYMSKALTWIEEQVSNPDIFPQDGERTYIP